MGILVQGGMLAGILAQLLPPLGEGLALGLYPLAKLVNSLAGLLGKLPGGVLPLRCLHGYEFILYYLFLAVAVWLWRQAASWPDGLAGASRKEKCREAVTKVAAACVIVIFCWQAPRLARLFSPRLEVFVFDVGQGDSILLRTPRGRYLLVDGGPSPRLVDRLLTMRGVRRLALAALTHGHDDHSRGFWPAVASRAPQLTWTDEAPPLGASLTVDGVRIELLGGGRGEDPNARSLILLVRYGGYGVLLTGDAPVSLVEAALAGRKLPPLVLKVPHHGGEGAVSERITARLKAAAISCGADNRYGHPAAETLKTLAEAGIFPERTDTDGCLTYVISGKGLEKFKHLTEKGLW
jgi:competence protein ComEC